MPPGPAIICDGRRPWVYGAEDPADVALSDVWVVLPPEAEAAAPVSGRDRDDLEENDDALALLESAAGAFVTVRMD